MFALGIWKRSCTTVYASRRMQALSYIDLSQVWYNNINNIYESNQNTNTVDKDEIN